MAHTKKVTFESIKRQALEFCRNTSKEERAETILDFFEDYFSRPEMNFTKKNMITNRTSWKQCNSDLLNSLCNLYYANVQSH